MSARAPQYERRIIRILSTPEGAKLLPVLSMFEITADQFIALSSIINRTNVKSLHTHILDHLPFIQDDSVTRTGMVIHRAVIAALRDAMQCKYHHGPVNIIIDREPCVLDTATAHSKFSKKANGSSRPPGRKNDGRKENHHALGRRTEKTAG